MNQVFLRLSICCVFWAWGYAIMLVTDNINTAFFWRAISVFGYCFFNGHWLYVTFLFTNKDKIKYISILKFLVYVPGTILFIANILVEPSRAMTKEYYGWIDVAPDLLVQNVYGIWAIIVDIAGLVILFIRGKYSEKNRVKKQTRIILIASIVSVTIGIITDFVLPMNGVIIFPSAVLAGTIAISGVCYAINKHRMMLPTSSYISEYIYNNANETIFFLNNEFIIENCNRAALNVTNYDFKELEGKKIDEFLECENFEFNILIENSYKKNIEVRLQKNDGSYIICELSSTIVYDEYKDMLGILVLLHDISERKRISEMEKNYTLKLEETNLRLKNQIEDRIRAEEQIRHYVYYDALTELPNRKMMLENLEALIENKRKNFALLFVDLDGFKSINDNLGHQAGDEVLKNVAIVLKGVIGADDIISRVGGDEFVFILRNLKSNSYPQEVAEKIQITLKRPFIYNNERLIVGASIGISIAPLHGEDSNTLIRKADVAMYEVKKNGGYDYVIYSSKMEDKIIDKLELKMKLNKAVEDDEFIIYYQPIMDLKTMAVLDFEALIRWKQGDKIIPPIEFVPMAKSVGEIVTIDNWTLENACAQCKEWNELYKGGFCVSVNTSYSQLKQPEFTVFVQSILEAYSLPPRCLNIEITEDESMDDLETIVNILTQLKKIGVKISLDDFGTGYSSLSYVNKLPIDKIKIDRSLVMDIEKEYKNIMVIKSIIQMGHSLDIKIVAEGIETKNQLRILNELECDFVQGYLIGKPMEASDFEEKFFNKEEIIINI